MSDTTENAETRELTIEEVLRHYGAEHIPQGSGWKSMRCPFRVYHRDSRASAAVNHGKNRFRCHACGTSGDPIDIIRRLEGLTFKEACGQAREVFGTSIEAVPQSVPRHTEFKPLGNERWKDILD